ncbi:MAG: 3'(2'),5'-bisphosphate nucleotidase CysQ [Gammaproteobacteria bacterium]
MPVENIADLLESVKAVALRAGEKILQVYGTEFKVDLKEDRSPLTKADLAAHHCIVEGLAQVSKFPIISEESSEIPFSVRRQWTTYWLVDPLDGTKEFIKRNGEFTVNIALIHGHKPVLGVVYAPAKKQCYFAAESVGAFRQTGNENALPIRVRSYRPEKLVVTSSRSHVTEDLKRYLNRLPKHELMSVGSSLKFCLIAEGSADVYPRLGPTCEWDTAAAQCVVEQAGGKVIELEGMELRYNTRDSFLNPFFLVIGDAAHDWAHYADLSRRK